MNKGFTLLETIVTIAVFTLMMGAVSWSIVSFYRTNSYIIQQSLAIDSARRGIETMVREIKEATYSDTGAYPIAGVAQQSLVFFSDIDKDSNVEKVRYFLDGANFKKGEIEASGNPPVYQSGNETIIVLSDSVRNGGRTIFTYYDNSGNEITNLTQIASIALIKVNLIINVDENRAPSEFTLYSTSQLRNLKTNL